MMFASKTPRALNHDPQPLVHPSGKRTPAFSYHFEFEPGEGGPYGRIAPAMFDPRPEFDHVQHSAPNPILVAFRERGDVCDIYSRRQWRNFLREGWDGSICTATPEQEAHAGKVFERWDEVARYHAIDELFEMED